MKLPEVWTEGFSDLAKNELQVYAAKKFRIHQLPESLQDWQEKRIELKEKIWNNLGTRPDHSLDLDLTETGSIKMDGYTVKNICYQSRPGFYVTGNIYIPDGDGPFPGVLSMHGHWSQGRLAERVQSRGHTLAKNGYVCLAVDAFGSGERCTEHGEYEYHGANIGASLLNVGETLMGMQIVDNMRGVDLLCSLPYVDSQKIGATGASGGGNQTMWVTAMDERIIAAMPVVSVGSFESYIMGSNCICELLPNGLEFTEESGILALIAPRALKICNALGDTNPTFFPSEMLRSYKEARKVFKAYDNDQKLTYQIFNTPHGYWPEMREAMLGWFDLHLKGIGHGAPRAEIPFEVLPEEKLMVFPKGKRPEQVMNIKDFCNFKANALRQAMLQRETVSRSGHTDKLKGILKIKSELQISEVHEYSPSTDESTKRQWLKFALESKCGRLIPLLVMPPREGNDYTILTHPQAKEKLETSSQLLELLDRGNGIIIPDLMLTGENNTKSVLVKVPYHTETRALMWLGRTMLGEWCREINLIVEFAKAELRAGDVAVCAINETGLAALFASAVFGRIKNLILHDMPLSYKYGNRDSELSMAIHVPGIMKWGDVSMAAALADAKIEIHNGINLDGSAAPVVDFTREVEQIKQKLSS